MRHKMLRFFVCLLTSTILLAHAVVPHHHEQEHSVSGHQHHHEADGGLKGIFTTHCHSSDCFTSVAKHAASERADHKQIGAAILAEAIPFIAGSRFIQPKNYTPSGYTHTSFHLINIDFRGPPAFSA